MQEGSKYKRKNIQIFLVGSSNSGKTSLYCKLKDNKFYEFLNATIGYYVHMIKLQINGFEETVQIWDTQGFDHNPGILSIPQYKQAKGFIVMYDITDRNSYQNVKKCVDEIKNYCSVQNHNILLIGNKKDQAQKRQVSIEQGMQYSQEQGIEFRQISVKNMEYQRLKRMIQQRVKLLAAKVIASNVHQQKNQEKKDKNVVIKKIDFVNNKNRGCWRSFLNFFKGIFRECS